MLSAKAFRRKELTTHLKRITAEVHSTHFAFSDSIILSGTVVRIADAFSQGTGNGFAAVVWITLWLKAGVGLHAKSAEVDSIDTHLSFAIVILLLFRQTCVADAFEVSIYTALSAPEHHFTGLEKHQTYYQPACARSTGRLKV